MKISDNIINPKLFFRIIHVKKGGFFMKTKVTRKEARKHLEQFHLAVELVKVIKHFFPDLIRLLKQTEDPRNQSYITYPNVILLMTRILSSIFYISSMRKTSQKFNSDTVIQNVWEICGESASADEIPYWETINKYLERLDPKELQDTVCQLVCSWYAAVHLQMHGSGINTGR